MSSRLPLSLSRSGRPVPAPKPRRRADLRMGLGPSVLFEGATLIDGETGGRLTKAAFVVDGSAIARVGSRASRVAGRRARVDSPARP